LYSALGRSLPTATVASLEPGPVPIDSKKLTLDVSPVQRCLLHGDTGVVRSREDGEGHRPHREITAKFGHETR
jgi:hypothetical protein